MRPLLLTVLIALASGCTGSGDSTPGSPKAAAPVSHGTSGDCVDAWNAPGNSANRSAAAAKHDGWSVTLSEWVIGHPAPDPSGDDLIGEGCSYFFYSSTHWRSYSGGWEADGDLRWGMPHGGGGRRTSEQRIQPPNAVHRQGKLVRLPTDDGQSVSGREWRAVIDDWYDNGEFDEAYRCAAVREAIEHVPTHGPSFHTAREDLLAFAEQVC